MAEPVLLISSDPFLGASLEAVARGRLQVARLDPSRRPLVWPGGPPGTVVLDVTARQREVLRAWIRHHHSGPLVVLLKPAERVPPPSPDQAQVVVARPFRLGNLVSVLENPPAPAPDVPGLDVPGPDAPAFDPDGPAFGPGAPAFDPGAPPPSAGAPAPHPGAPEPDPPDSGAPAWEGSPTPGSGRPAVHSPPGRERPTARTRERPTARTRERPAAGTRGWPTARTRLDVRRRRSGWWRRSVLTRVLLGLLVLVVLAGAWLVLGLLEARRDLQVGAAGVRVELAAAEDALAGGRTGEAAAHVRAARSSLQVAAAVPDRPELRVAARLPGLGGGVADTRRLLAAAGDLTVAAERAVDVAARLGPGREAVVRGGRFDLGALEDAATQARGMLAGLAAARERLAGVRGGPLAPGVDGTRRWALDRVVAATARAAPVAATLDALPAAAGGDQPRSYLLVLTTPAGPWTGGDPLAAREVVLDHGAATLRPGAGALLDALGRVPPSADFRATGRAMAAAAASQGQPRPDGVVALDPLAVRALLAATGPVEVPGHGRLDAAGAERELTGDADRAYAQAVLEATAGRLLGGRDLLAAGRALGEAGASGHLRAYAADPAVARLLARQHLDGATDQRG